jgi:hypothetical protein
MYMKKVLVFCAVLFGLALVLFFIMQQKEEITLPAVDDQASQETPLSTEKTSYGFSYTYRSGNEGYRPYTPKDGIRGDLVFTQSLFDTQAYEELIGSDVPREAPVSLTFSVYRNPFNLEAREWITKTPSSNYQLSSDGTIRTVTLGGTEYLTYQFDGLYRADAYVYASNGYVYLFTNMWENPESNMKKDMEEVIQSTQWSEPSLPSQVAHGDIVVSAPSVGAAVTSPLLIKGEARGNWFFEASFPVVLVDWDGRIIGEGIAQAEGEWMTEAFVPFEAEIIFQKPEYNDKGTLILKKENPSGFPQNDDAIEIPVTFK